MATSTPDFARRRADLQRLYADSLSQLSADQRGLFTQWGFQGGVDEGGALGMQIDPNLQYGNVHQLLRGHDQGLRNLRSETQQRGIGKTGLAAQRQKLLKFVQGQDLTGFMDRFQGALGGINRQRFAAGQDLNRGNSDVDFDMSSWLASQAPNTSATTTDPNDPAAAAAVDPGQFYDWGQPVQQKKRLTGTWGLS